MHASSPRMAQTFSVQRPESRASIPLASTTSKSSCARRVFGTASPLLLRYLHDRVRLRRPQTHPTFRTEHRERKPGTCRHHRSQVGRHAKALDIRGRVAADGDRKPEMRTPHGRFDQSLSPPAEPNDRRANHRPLFVGGQGNVFNASDPSTEEPRADAHDEVDPARPANVSARILDPDGRMPPRRNRPGSIWLQRLTQQLQRPRNTPAPEQWHWRCLPYCLSVTR